MEQILATLLGLSILALVLALAIFIFYWIGRFANYYFNLDIDDPSIHILNGILALLLGTLTAGIGTIVFTLGALLLT